MEHREKGECWKTEERCPERTETCSRNTMPFMKQTFSTVGCGRMWKVKKRRERLNKEAKEEGRTSGKREVEGDRERVEIQRICLDHVSSKAFEALCPNSEGRVLGILGSPPVCVCALLDPSNGACGGFLQF